MTDFHTNDWHEGFAAGRADQRSDDAAYYGEQALGHFLDGVVKGRSDMLRQVRAVVRHYHGNLPLDRRMTLTGVLAAINALDEVEDLREMPEPPEPNAKPALVDRWSGRDVARGES